MEGIKAHVDLIEMWVYTAGRCGELNKERPLLVVGAAFLGVRVTTALLGKQDFFKKISG